MQLSAAQRALAGEYGCSSWTALIREVDQRNAERAPSLIKAVRAGDLKVVHTLLAAGANPQLGDGREAPLHAAARRGPLALVEALISAGAREWLVDRNGRTPLDVARRARPRQRAAIVALLDRTTIGDAAFRAAVDAIHRGDVDALARAIDERPSLLHERAIGPDAYRRADRSDYFRDPKLFWFVANNPTLIDTMPRNITSIAQCMIDRGVEPADLNYTLGLTMTSSVAREQGLQIPLMRTQLAAGAVATRLEIESAAAHGEREALRELLRDGAPSDASIAASLGDIASLRDALRTADSAAVQSAFGLAVINGEAGAAALALDAGADVNAFMPVHRHGTALHSAALTENAALIELLLARGARTETRDTLWNATPLGWAIHENKPIARAILERAAPAAATS